MTINRETSVQKLIAMPKELAAQVDADRFDNRIKSEAEATRRLIKLGLKAKSSTPEPQPR